jgi:hypothetical protein
MSTIRGRDIDKLERISRQLRQKIAMLRAVGRAQGKIAVATREKRSLTDNRLLWQINISLELEGRWWLRH